MFTVKTNTVMRSSALHYIKFTVTAFFLCIWIEWIPAYAQESDGETDSTVIEDKPEADEDESADEIEEWKDKNLQPPLTDRIGSTVGAVLYFPIRVPLMGIRAGLGYIDETKIIDKFNDLLESDDGTRKIEPVFWPNRGIGARYKQMRLYNDETMLSFTGAFWLYSMQTYELGLLDLPIIKDSLYIDGSLSYYYHPIEHFYGIGNNSKEDEKSYYQRKAVLADVSLNKRFWKDSVFSIIAGYDFNDVSDGARSPSLFDPANPFSYTSPQLLAMEGEADLLNVKLQLETRDVNLPFRPSKGYEVMLNSGLYTQTNGDDYGFWKHHVDAKAYIHLFNQRILTLRAAADVTNPQNNRSIPFYYLSELGAFGTLRGYNRQRFRDRDALYGSIEYTYPLREIWEDNGIDFVIFTDFGKVMNDLAKDILDSHFHYGLGFGLSLWNRDSSRSRFEVAFSDEEVKFYIVIGF